MSGQEITVGSSVSDPNYNVVNLLNTVEPSPPPNSSTYIPLDDCKCPICLDFFIDVVETRCHHRFCNFCLENWLHVGVHRQCPTCRSTIQGPIPIKPELQDAIDASIQNFLTEEEVRERLRIRSERQALVQRFSVDREQTQALLASITSSRHRARQIRRVRRFPDIEDAQEPGSSFLSRHITNWWDDNSPPPPPVNVADETVPYDREVDERDFGFSWLQRGLNNLQDNIVTAPSAPEVVTNATIRPNWSRNSPNTTRNNQRVHRRRASPSTHLLDQSYHENLMEEYSYHLRRVNSAHTRIREAYRDFNYHNGRMQEILQEHRSFFSRMRTTDNLDAREENNVVTYEDFEDLIGAEIGELLDNSPAAQVVFSSVNSRGAVDPQVENSLYPVIFDEGYEPIFPRNNRGNTRRSTRHGSLAHRTNVLDMEHEIRHRRNQLNRLSSNFRQSPRNSQSDAIYTRGGDMTNNTSERIPTTSAPNSTPIQYLQQRETQSNERDQQLRQTSGQHQIMVERLTSTDANNTVPYPRRNRRRVGRTTILRTNDNGSISNPGRRDEVSISFVQNSRSENTLVPAMASVGETNISNVDTGTSVGTLSNTVPSTPSRPANVGVRASRNLSQSEHLRDSQGPRDVEWINARNESSDSESPQRTARASNRSPHSTSRAMSLSPRRYRRAVRFYARRQTNVVNGQSTDGSTATVPVSSSSNTNTSVPGDQNDNLSTTANADMNSNDGTLERISHVSDGDAILESNANPVAGPDESGVENDSDGMSSMREDIASMNNYLKTLCDQFKTR